MNTKRRIALLLELPADSPDSLGMIALRRLLKGLAVAVGVQVVSITEQDEEPFTGPLVMSAEPLPWYMRDWNRD